MDTKELLNYLAVEIDECERIQKDAETKGNRENACYYIGRRSACSEVVTKIKTP